MHPTHSPPMDAYYLPIVVPCDKPQVEHFWGKRLVRHC